MAKVLLISGVVAIMLIVIGVGLARVEQVPVSNKHLNFNRLLPGDIRFEPVALLYTGIWLLMFTPVFGLLAALVGALCERDWRLFIIILLLLLVLSQGVFMLTNS